MQPDGSFITRAGVVFRCGILQSFGTGACAERGEMRGSCPLGNYVLGLAESGEMTASQR